MMSDAVGTHRGRIIAKLTLAMLLASVIPLLVAAYGLYGGPPPLTSESGDDLTWTVFLLASAVACAAAGAVMLWRLLSATRATGTSLSLSAPLEAGGAATVEPRQQPKLGADGGRQEVDSLMDSLSRVLTTIEQQSAEINQYASRLDSAYREIETSSARLKEFSFKDEVTGLYNRRFFSIRLEEEVSRYRRFDHPVSVVLMDLDRFKAVNDDLGHSAGDETLRGFADILLKHSRGINVICRYGGDEFAVLLVETSKVGARRYADRIRDVLPAYRFGHGRRVTASFGIASLPEDVAPSPDELIRAADEALYAAKRAGKNRVSLHGDIRASRSSEGRSEP
jgi:diguanylate cyclase (GGDEF)-like protein